MTRLPTFIIAGAMRSGTTSLNGYLREHPQIAVSQPKEVHFFDLHFDRGIAWYGEHFPDADLADAIGEATPDYLYHPEAAERIAATIPQVKIVLMLRNPIDRAYSHYWHNRSRASETLDFAEAVDAEPRRLEESAEDRRIFSYVDRGRYAGQIERLHGSIPRDRVHVATFDALNEHPLEVYASVCRFLGVDDSFVPEGLGAAINAYVEFRSPRLRRMSKGLPGPLRRAVGRLNQKSSSGYPPMDAALRSRLRDEFSAANRGLAELVDIAIPDWD